MLGPFEEVEGVGVFLRSVLARVRLGVPLAGAPGDRADAGLALRRAADMSAAVEPVACCAPLTAPTLSDAEADATAELFRALGDPARVKIANRLANPTAPSARASSSRSGSRSRPSAIT